MEWRCFEENTTATKVDKGVRFHYPFYGRRWGTNRQIITLRNEPPVDEVTATVLFHTADEVMTVGNDSLQVVEKSDYLLQSGKSYTSEYSQTLTLKGEEADKEYVAINPYLLINVLPRMRSVGIRGFNGYCLPTVLI